MTNNTTHQVSDKNNAIFKILSILLIAIFFVLFELVLRLISYGDNMHLVIDHPAKTYSDYYSVNPKIGEKYFSKFDATGTVNDIFLKEKPDNGYRIFVLGSSTMVGFPYGKNLMATRILHQRLQDTYPDQHIEIVNTAITAINSITLNDFMNEIVDYDADAILIYAGHNEYYGAFGVGSNETMSQNKTIRNLHFKLMHWRMYQLFRNVYANVGRTLAKKNNSADSKGSLMKRIVADEDIALNSEKYNIGIQQYKSNMQDILQKANKHSIPVFISSLASNVKDLNPLSAVTDDNNEANALFKAACEELNQGNTGIASDLFYQAKDVDPIRFRAPEEINTIIKQMASDNNANFVDAKKTFQAEAIDGIIGNDLMTEHVHPTIAGQFVLANVFYAALVASEKIGQQSNPHFNKTSADYKRNWGYTALDSLSGSYKVKQLKSYWPFTALSTEKTFRDKYKPKDKIDSLAFSLLLPGSASLTSIHEDLAEEHINQNNYTEAAKEYNVLMQLNPYRTFYFNQAANVQLKLDDLYKAERYLKHSTSLHPTHFAYLMLAEIEMIKNDFTTAAKYYEKTIALASSKDEKATLLQKTYIAYHYAKNEVKKADTKTKLDADKIEVPNPIPSITIKYSDYIPQDIAIKISTIRTLLNANKTDDALLLLEQCIKVNDAPIVNRLIGDALYQKKQNELLHYYQEAYPYFNKELPFLYNYCIAYYVNKEMENAESVLKEMITLGANEQMTANLKTMIKLKKN